MTDTRRPAHAPHPTPWERSQLERAREQLAAEFPTLPDTIVDDAVGRATSGYSNVVRRNYVPRFVEDTARRELAAHAHAARRRHVTLARRPRRGSR